MYPSAVRPLNRRAENCTIDLGTSNRWFSNRRDLREPPFDPTIQRSYCRQNGLNLKLDGNLTKLCKITEKSLKTNFQSKISTFEFQLKPNQTSRS